MATSINERMNLEPVRIDPDPTETVVDTRQLFVDIDPTKPLADQIFADGVARGREDMVGLEFYQYGLRREITDYDEIHGVKRQIEYGVGRDPRGRFGIKNREKTKWVPQQTKTYTMTTFNQDGEVVDTASFSADELKEYFNKDDSRAPSDKMVGFQWLERVDDAKKVTSIVPVGISLDKHPFAQILQQQEGLSLPNLEGLTWTTGQYTNRIEQELVLTRTVKGEQRRTPAWVVKTYDPKGNITKRETYVDDSLAKYFKSATSKPDDIPKLDLRWEITEPSLPAGESSAWEAWGADIPPPPVVEPVGATELDIEGAYRLMLGLEVIHDADIRSSGATPIDSSKIGDLTGNIEKIKKQENAGKYAQALVDMAEVRGVGAIRALASEIRDRAIEQMAANNLQPLPSEHNIDWAIRELARRYHFAKHPEEFDIIPQVDTPAYIKELHGLRLTDPFEDTETAKRMLDEIVAIEVGRVFEDHFVTFADEITIERVETAGLNGKKLLKEQPVKKEKVLKKGKKSVVTAQGQSKSVEFVEFDKNLYNKLPAIVRQDIMDIVQRGRRDAQEKLVPEELKKIGNLLYLTIRS